MKLVKDKFYINGQPYTPSENMWNMHKFTRMCHMRDTHVTISQFKDATVSEQLYNDALATFFQHHKRNKTVTGETKKHEQPMQRINRGFS